jgi:hypothetical protein
MRITKSFKYFDVDLTNQWTQLTGKYNWYEFDLLKLYFEKDVRHGCMEVMLYILGFGIRVYWVYNVYKNNKAFERYDKIMEGMK